MKRILLIFCGISMVVAVPLIKEKKEDVEVIKSSSHSYSDFYAFQYSLSDGQIRQELITFDDEKEEKGISVRGSYTLQLEDGSMQTIFYVSDVNGHRVSIGQPFTESEITQKPIVSVRRAFTAPTKKPEIAIERNLKQQEEEEIEDRTKKIENEYLSDEDVIEGAAILKQKLINSVDVGKRRKL